jgi:hypothetical protein
MTHTIPPHCYHHLPIVPPNVFITRNPLFQHLHYLHRYLLLHHLVCLMTTENRKLWKVMTLDTMATIMTTKSARQKVTIHYDSLMKKLLL